MELTLNALSSTQVSVTCDDSYSHTFDPLPLVPQEGDESRPQPLENPIRYGESIFSALFPAGSPARGAFEASPERIMLVADDVLQAIPWEYVRSNNGFIAAEIPFVRGLPKDKRIATPTLAEGLHILAVPSNPLGKDIAPLNIDGEWLRLTEIVGEIEAAITLERVRPATPDRLGELATGRHDLVVHFMGHGGMSESGAVLFFEQETGALQPTSGRSFANLIRRKAFFVTLNACVSATPGATEFDNLAATLVAQGIPYALGMRFSIVDDDARDLARTLYGQLARGESVEQAVTAARAKLAHSVRAWAIGVPVLYAALDQPAEGFKRIDGGPTIRENQPRLDVSAIPRAAGTFQGRSEELIALGTMLTGDSRPPVLTIHALGGQGKTALAREAVERFGWAWSGGVWAITLENLPTRAAFVAALARFLSLDPASVADPADLEKAVLARLSKRTLLVLDNAETLVQAVERQHADAIRLTRFLREDLNGTRAHLLITSRDLLGFAGEASIDLGGLSYPEGAQLFRENTPTRQAEIDPARAEILSNRVFGHPLSLRLLAGAFDNGQMPLASFVGDYEQRLREAEDKYKDLDDRHRSIRAAIDTSARELSDELRDLLSGLWLFHAPFLREIATAIFDPDSEYSEGEQSPIYDHLHQLWRRGLLVREGTTLRDGTVLLYRVLPAVRLYAEQMLQAQERTVLLARFGAAYAALVRTLFNEINRSGVMAFIAQQIADDLTRGLEFVEPESEVLGHYLLQRGWIAEHLGDWQTGLRLNERVLEIAEGRYQRLHLDALNNLALVYSSIGQPTKARELHEQRLPILRKIGDQVGEATTLSNLAAVYHAIGQPTKARELYEQALAIQRAVGDRLGEATTLNNLMSVYHAIGQPTKSRELLEQALPILRAVGHRAGEATTLSNLAAVYSDIGQPARARELYEQALPIQREVGDRAGEATTLSNLAAVYHAIGQPTKARELLEQALPIQREVGDRAGEATTLSNLASVYHAIGQPTKSRELLEQALPIRHEVGDRTGEAITLNNLGGLYFSEGDYEKACATQLEVANIMHEVGNIAGEAATLNNLATAMEQLGRREEAIVYKKQSIEILENTNLEYDGSGTPLTQIRQELAQIQGDSVPSDSAKTMPAEQLRMIVSNTVAVMTVVKEKQDDWRAVIDKALQDAKIHGAGWQIEIDFFAAVLIVLDGHTPSLPEDHPYAIALKQIQVGIAAGGLPEDEGEDKPTDAATQVAPHTVEIVRAFLDAEGWDSTRRVVEQNQDLLLGAEVAALFERLVAQAQQANNQQSTEMFTFYLALLRDCQANGIDAAFARIKVAQAANETSPPNPVPPEFVARCAAALTGAPADKAALFGYLNSLPTSDPDLAALVTIVQRALFMSNPAVAPNEGELSDIYADTWQHILDHLKGDAS